MSQSPIWSLAGTIHYPQSTNTKHTTKPGALATWNDLVTLLVIRAIPIAVALLYLHTSFFNEKGISTNMITN